MDQDRLKDGDDLNARLRSVTESYHGPVSVNKLIGDASTRVFFRLTLPSGETSIAMCYPQATIPEAATFVEIQQYLLQLGLPVPAILSFSKESGVILLEDLGDRLLESVGREAESSTRLKFYEEAVDIISRMIIVTRDSPVKIPAHYLAFDFDKLSFEMDFFVKNFVKGLLRTDLSASAEKELRSSLYSICDFLSMEPQFFAHRDYHARNLMIHHEGLVMIDFQDARMGPVQYDLASLLRDSYVTLDENLTQHLLMRFYEDVKSLANESCDRFLRVFDIMCLQRNIKALGTFGYQMNVVGSDRYSSSIFRAVQHIESNLSRNPDLLPNPQLIRDLALDPSKSLMT